MKNKRTVTIGDKFHRWTVIESAPPKGYIRKWKCKCECGRIKIADERYIVNGRSKSCGCLSVERVTKHGQAKLVNGNKTPTYRSWQSMIRRHIPTKQSRNRSYIERGTTVCERWKSSFVAFLQDVGPRPVGMTLDRIDNNGNYEPGNCRWATPVQQARNSGKRINNKTGFTGVRVRENGKFQAMIETDNKQRTLGTFANIEDASAAYQAAHMAARDEVGI